MHIMNLSNKFVLKFYLMYLTEMLNNWQKHVKERKSSLRWMVQEAWAGLHYKPFWFFWPNGGQCCKSDVATFTKPWLPLHHFCNDGDYKTYKELQSLAPYSVPIKKEECINHVSKRLGTALRNLVTNEAKLGTTLGGRKAGSLSQVTIFY